MGRRDVLAFVQERRKTQLAGLKPNRDTTVPKEITERGDARDDRGKAFKVPRFTIVGILRDAKYNDLREKKTDPMMWVPLSQAPQKITSVTLRVQPGAEGPVIRAAEAALKSYEPAPDGSKDDHPSGASMSDINDGCSVASFALFCCRWPRGLLLIACSFGPLTATQSKGIRP
jgi:hypothetical protein